MVEAAAEQPLGDQACLLRRKHRKRADNPSGSGEGGDMLGQGASTDAISSRDVCHLRMLTAAIPSILDH